MSDMAISTGREDRACSVCGIVLSHTVAQTVYQGEVFFSPTEDHLAPCGRPCLSRITDKAILRRAREEGKPLHEICHTKDRCPCNEERS